MHFTLLYLSICILNYLLSIIKNIRTSHCCGFQKICGLHLFMRKSVFREKQKFITLFKRYIKTEIFVSHNFLNVERSCLPNYSITSPF